MATTKNPFGKTRDKEHPYAMYRGPGIEWRVLKTYSRPDLEKDKPFARWMVAAQSEATFGGWDMGDTYISAVLPYAQLVDCTSEWAEHYT